MENKLPKNKFFFSCIDQVPNGRKILKELNISKYYNLQKQEISFSEQDGLYFYIPRVRPQNYIAAFDIDWTLTYSEKKLFPRDEDDIQLLPNREKMLIQLFKMGYTIVLFTNQKAKSKKEKNIKINRIKTLIRKIQLPVFVFIATENNQYRKPNIGMWEKCQEIIPGIKYGFYVGDAVGRKQDFSDSDKLFAANANIPFFTPEKFFEHNTIPNELLNNNREKTMIILVGAPGTGKSSFTEKYLIPMNFFHLERDVLAKTKKKFFKIIKETAEEGKNFVIDATNPKQEDREIYYKLAAENNYNIVILYFVRNGYEWNKLRKNKVSMIVFHKFYKSLVPPTENNTPGIVYKIDESRN